MELTFPLILTYLLIGFLSGFLFAQLEIHIRGAAGWAQNLPARP